MGSIAERSELWCTRVFDYWVVIPSIQKNTASGIMYIWENSTTITRNSPTIESESKLFYPDFLIKKPNP